MALTAAQINKIARIVGVQKSYLNAHITSLGSDLTAQDETDIAVEVARWDAGAGTDFVSFTPTESNKGFNKKASVPQNDIIRNLAILLQLDYVSVSSIGTIEINTY
jgi:hypothetical protein